MKMSKNTTIYLESLKRDGIAKTEAFKAQAKKAVKATFLYGGATVSICVALGLGITVGILKVQDFFKSNEIVFALPVEMKVWTNQVVTVTPVKPTVLATTASHKELKELVETYTKPTVAQKICDKFGPLDCKLALTVANGEGLNHPADGFNINTNGTIDVGYFRINSIHFNKEGCSLAEVITEDGNINCAHKLWVAQGPQIWVAYQKLYGMR